ncbi:RPA-related protein RADX isoform X2 [Vanacampus margaritifer]
MAAPDCILRRTLARSRVATNQRSQVVCRETLYLLDVLRYTRDLGFAVYFPHTIFTGDNLYDITLSDGDCRLRVTLHPKLNGLVEKNVLRQGTAVRNVTLAPAMTGLADRAEDESFIVDSMEVSAFEGSQDSNQDSLPWIGSSDVSGPLLAYRKVFLPLWNSRDYYGHTWNKTAPPQEDQEEMALRPTTTIKGLRQAFLSHDVWVMGTILRRLIVRVTAKSHLTYYGRADRNCACPYQALLEAHDPSGSVSLVLWNSVCVDWYRVLKPGDIISLSRFRVKQRYNTEDDIELSINSQKPAAHIALLPEASVAPDCLPQPATTFSFCNSEELVSRSHGALCDIIGLLTFMGRTERTRKESELLEYRWLRLQDGRSSRPIWIQLFSTSQPKMHRRLHPLSVLMCSRLRVVQTAAGLFYLTNTSYTQLHRSGQRNRYGQLPEVQRFLDWFRQQDEDRLLRSALIGGYFVYPSPPVSLEAYMKQRQGEPGFLSGAELLRELDQLIYRERRAFCIQATVTMVTYCRRGEEERCIFWRDASSLSSLSSADSSPQILPLSPVNQSTPYSGRLSKRKLLMHSDTPQKRRPRATVQPEVSSMTTILFGASKEFLQDTDDDDDGDEEEEDQANSSYATCPSSPDFPHVAVETLVMRYDPAHQKEQVVSVTMGGSLTHDAVFTCDHYYTLRLKALSDGVCIPAIFLPQSSSSSLLPPSRSHDNTWASILSHGAFSSHAPPPSPGDLIATATLLANQRLVCLLNVCNLGGELESEVVLSRAFCSSF